MYNTPNEEFERQFEENRRPRGLSVREQLAQLEAENKEEEVQNEIPQPIVERIDEKKDEDVFKKPEKEKAEMDKKVLITMGIITFLILVVIIVFVLLGLRDNGQTATNTGTTDKITETSTGTGNIDTDTVINNRLELPGEINSVDDAIEAFSNNNSVVVSYLEDMRTLVINYNNRDRNDIYIEDLMEEYTDAILVDIDNLSKYKTHYDAYNASDLYLVTLERYQNAYNLANNADNAMTEKALVNSANSYIEKEEALNTRATTAFASFLKNNDIEYTLEENKIVIK